MVFLDDQGLKVITQPPKPAAPAPADTIGINTRWTYDDGFGPEPAPVYGPPAPAPDPVWLGSAPTGYTPLPYADPVDPTGWLAAQAQQSYQQPEPQWIGGPVSPIYQGPQPMDAPQWIEDAPQWQGWPGQSVTQNGQTQWIAEDGYVDPKLTGPVTTVPIPPAGNWIEQASSPSLPMGNYGNDSLAMGGGAYAGNGQDGGFWGGLGSGLTGLGESIQGGLSGAWDDFSQLPAADYLTGPTEWIGDLPEAWGTLTGPTAPTGKPDSILSGLTAESSRYEPVQDLAQRAGEGAQRWFEDTTSGEAALGEFNIDTSNVPDEWYMPVRQAVDVAAAPATWITAGLGESVPVIGSAFGGGLARQLAGETALGTAGLVAGQKSAELADKYTDNPWIVGAAGIGGGLLGAGGLYAGMRGLKGAPGFVESLDQAINEPANLVDDTGRSLRGMDVPEPEIPRRPTGLPDETLSNVPPAPEIAALSPGTPSIEIPEPTPRTPPLDVDSIEMNDARRALLKAVQSEVNYRRTGGWEEAVRAGRSTQAGNYTARLAEGRAKGLRGGELADYARQGFKTGPFGKAVAPIMDLTPEQRIGLVDEAMKAFEDRGAFDVQTVANAVQKMLNGERPQPREIRFLREAFGDEVADVMAARPRSKVLSEDVKIQRETERMNTSALKKQEQAAEREVQRLNRAVAESQEVADRAMYRQKWKALAAENDAEHIRQLLADPFMTPEERHAAVQAVTKETGRAQNVAGRETERLWEQARKANPDAEDLRRRAKALIEKKVEDPELQSALNDGIALWLSKQRVILDAVGDDRIGLYASLRGSLSGNAPDSYMASLLHQRSFLRAAMEQQGLDSDIAKQVANILTESEVRRRFRGTLPEHIKAMLDATKTDYSDSATTMLRGAAEGSQMLKNTQFGIGDVAVFGQQGLKAVGTSWPQMIAGATNKLLTVLHLPHVETKLPGITLPRRIQYMQDGVIHGVSTGMTDLSSDGTLVSLIPKVGKTIDAPLVAATRKLTDFQFQTILGTLRDIVYEGNLVLAHVAKQDITDPRVRAVAAQIANSATSAAPMAQGAKRALLERTVILSPSMRRAQVAQILQVAKVFTVKASATERLLGATTILASAGSLLAIGKLLNDYIGVEEFEFDPSKPGFGRVTLPNGRVIDLFPQEQVVKAIARSVREVAEGDYEDAARVWGNLGISSSSPVAQIAERSVGIGFEASQGRYAYGDLNRDLDLKGRLLNAAPIPPFFRELWEEGVTPTSGLSALGVNSFQESDYTERDRNLKNDPQFGKPYKDLEPYQKIAAEQKYGVVYSTNPEWADKQKRADQVEGDRRKRQEQIDGWLEAGQKPDGTKYTPDDWRRDRGEIYAEVGGRYREIYGNEDFPDANPRDRYYTARTQFTDAATGEVDWDKLEEWLAAQSKEDREYIERNTGLNRTAKEQEYREDVDRIADSGYFDLTKGKMEFRQKNPEIAELVRKWGYSKDSIAAEDATKEIAKQQRASDEMRRQNKLSAEEWRNDYRDRMDELSARKKQIYAAYEEDGMPTTNLDKWFAQIDAAKQADGKTNWDLVDKWVADQPSAVQREIANYTGVALTPMVAEYRKDVKKIEQSGYWDIGDYMFGMWLESRGEDPRWTQDAYWDSIRGQLVGFAEEYFDANYPGWRKYRPDAAQTLAEPEFQKLYRRYSTKVSEVNKLFRDENPDIRDLLQKWGYAGLGQEEVAKTFGLSN